MDLLYAFKEVLWPVFLAGAIYGGIRTDLRGMFQSITDLKASVSRAHERLDEHIDRGGKT
jgi:hypothetical protein